MNETPLTILLAILVLLICLSAFFSSSETGMMALNRYRLNHLAKQKHRGAIRTSKLLERPDRLIGLILLGNNFVNLLASGLATAVAIRLWGEAGIIIATLFLTAVVLIFAEVTPKTLAVLHPERIAFPASFLLTPLLKIFYPAVWIINWLSNGLLWMVGVRSHDRESDKLTSDELRTVVNEAGALISRRHKQMLVSILDLDTVTVEDIMIPRNEINGIDIESPEEDIQTYLANNRYGRIPIYRGDITDVIGIVRTRELLMMAHHRELDEEHLVTCAKDPYFVPAGTPLHTQLVSFQRNRERVGLVVDEYGDIQGMVTLEDILEEIVGEFTTDPAASIPDVHEQPDGSFLVDASASVRVLNRTMNWDLPTDGPKTMNGLILEHLENIPEPGTSMLLARYPIDIVQMRGHAVKTVRLHPQHRQIASGPRAEAQMRL